MAGPFFQELDADERRAALYDAEPDDRPSASEFDDDLDDDEEGDEDDDIKAVEAAVAGPFVSILRGIRAATDPLEHASAAAREQRRLADWYQAEAFKLRDAGDLESWRLALAYELAADQHFDRADQLTRGARELRRCLMAAAAVRTTHFGGLTA